ncbi:MAG: aldehyde dehydrogenase family protein [Chloroflexota bacterium]
MTKDYRFYCAGEWRTSDNAVTVTNPYSQEPVGRTWMASADDLEDAIAGAVSAFEETSTMPTYQRAEILFTLSNALKERADEFTERLCAEAGKPINDARVEVDRGVFTLRLAAEEAQRIEGEQIPLDLMASSRGRFGITRRVPAGPVAGISPFNFPLNLALHKIAPAIASGNSIVLKPPTYDPLTMLAFAELVASTDLPPGAVSIMPMNRDVGDKLVCDDRFALLSFTGSPDVGWDMKSRAGKKKVVLELGGNAGVIIDRDADLDFAVNRVLTGAFAYAGQVCISVQRVYIHQDVFDDFAARLVEAAQDVVMGDPSDPQTALGPMIDEKAVKRVDEWVKAAADSGDDILTGGSGEGRFYKPTVIANAPKQAAVCAREAFAPIVNIFPFSDWDAGLNEINDSVYGLQAGVFTNTLEHALKAFDRLVVGGVIINDIPTYRVDHMPYGGVKDSGLSREGLKYAIEDMTETRLMVFNRL